MTPTDDATQVKPNDSRRRHRPARAIYLGHARAACWMDQLDRMLTDGEHDSPCLEQLRNVLEDGCWLARWKREDVIIDICPTMLADLVETLLRISPTDLSIEGTRVLEEIVQVLSRVNTLAATK